MTGPRLLPPPPTRLSTNRGLHLARSLLRTGNAPPSVRSQCAATSQARPRSWINSRVPYYTQPLCRFYTTPATTPSAIASTSSAGPEDALSADEPVVDQAAWKERIQKKRSYADFTLKFAERGDGPGWPDYLRRRLLRIAEAELEEQSWGPKQALPKETQMAAACFKAAIEALLVRGELLTSAKLLEDWIRFRLVQGTSSQQQAIDTSLLVQVVHELTVGPAQDKPSKSHSPEQNLNALRGVREACSEASLAWTGHMNLQAGNAFRKAGLGIDAMDVLIAELRRFSNESQLRQELTRSSRLEDAEAASQGDPVIAQILFKGMAKYLRQARDALSMRVASLSKANQASRHLAIVEYFSLLNSLADLLREQPSSLNEVSRSSSYSFVIKCLCTAPELSRLIEQEFMQLGAPLQEQVTEAVESVHLALSGYIAEVFVPSSSSNIGTAQVSNTPSADFMKLDGSTLATLVRYAMRHLSSSEDLVQHVVSATSQMVEQGSITARSVLTTQLNEAVLARDPDLEEKTLQLMLHEDGHALSSRSASKRGKEILAPRDDVLLLLKSAHHKGDLYRVNVLIRYLSAGGRLRSALQNAVEQGLHETTGSSGRISAADLVRVILPSMPRLFDPSQILSPSSEDSLVLATSATCLALLNAAVKTGSHSLASDLYQYISWFRNQGAEGRQAVSLPEATCYLQSLEDIGVALLSQLQRQAMVEAARSHKEFSAALGHPQEEIKAEANPARSSREILDDLFDLRSQARKAYEDLVEHWSSGVRQATMPTPNGRFYNAVLGALLWPKLIEILPPSVLLEQRDEPAAREQPRGMNAYFRFNYQHHARRSRRPHPPSAAYESLERLYTDPEALQHLVVILSDVSDSGLPIPPGYQSLLVRAGYKGERLFRHVEGADQRKGRSIQAGKLAVRKDRGLIISAWSASRKKRAKKERVQQVKDESES
ncbi:hypothetical protein BCV69DRAFT_180723 [Microstroma glucosiphilum]|uniref:Uncharacterized protein n=1 Tax=Pseudomicrostroma glucosiphilum TaxID=1684307 RepID=A0A316U723_9BASI|nr:hypothetical protein BCV69DRAFT_180723 [Pseudomicrostroma glucosiphilum]PWN20992.1 hypothetical protein BCV69DRAFT_180723 [Pseudomicrostroma glucosiphilum]